MQREDRQYSCYLMASRSRVLYCGVTGNIFLRVFDHKRLLGRGFTAKYKCTRLVWYQVFTWVGSAIHRETEIKGWLREKKTALIAEKNPLWDDLAANWFTPDQLAGVIPRYREGEELEGRSEESKGKS